MAKDYYKILGIEKNASVDDIKAAFRRLAHQYHPDKKGGNAEKFKEANEAFQVLSDPQKRGQYDQFGTTFEQAQAQGGFSGFNGFRDFAGFAQGFSARGGSASGGDFGDLGDIFSGFGDIFGGRAGERGGKRTRRGSDIQVDMEIDLKEAAFGAEKTIRLYKNSSCDVCSGTGVEPGSKMVKCKECNGRGQKETTQHTIFGSFQTAAPCRACEGAGEKPERICRQCGGRGIGKKHEEINVKIPAGIDDGESIRLSSRGETGAQGGQAGDLYLRIHVRPDPRFRRDDFDLYIKKNISFTQAALGDTAEVETLEGAVKVIIPEGVQSGQMIRLKGRGIGHLHDSGRGDLYVEVIVMTPRKISKKQKELLKQLGE
ncbi:MAG: molecular chaperone DnaJ [Candidatus Magasanikbacteria bacterium]|nr:molecular chaperone DnaJ [Candidatus Magasanikbacteria bacterium]